MYTESGDLLPGVLRFEEVMEKTVALWQHDVGEGTPAREYRIDGQTWPDGR